MVAREKYDKIQVVSFLILVIINIFIFALFVCELYVLWYKETAGISAIAGKQKSTVLCVYSGCISAYVLFEQCLIVLMPYLSPKHIADSLACQSYRFKNWWYQWKDYDIPDEMLNNPMQVVNKEASKWTNVVELSLVTVLHVLLLFFVKQKISEGCYLEQFQIDCISFFIIPLSLAIAIISTIAKRNAYNPNDP